MSTDNHNKNNVGAEPPLRRFLQARRESNGDITLAVTAASLGPIGWHQQAAYESENSTQRRPSSPQRVGAGYNRPTQSDAKPRSHKRPRKSQLDLPNPTRNANHSLPGIVGCRECGSPIDGTYSERCENCFADASERWNGKDQSAVIHW